MVDKEGNVVMRDTKLAENLIGGEGFVTAYGEEMYRIADFDRMDPFLMNVVSASDFWVYVSSSGALTAGRTKPEHCLFPYETDNNLHAAGHRTGPMTVLRVGGEVWRPFFDFTSEDVKRNLYKSVLGNVVVFEEFNERLGLRFAYKWCATEKLGLIRTSYLENTTAVRVKVDVLDGVTNLLPAGMDGLGMLQTTSCLMNAYIQTELINADSLCVVALTSKISDTTEPAESFHANTFWQWGLKDAKYLLSQKQMRVFFEKGAEEIKEEHLLRGERSSYFAAAEVQIEAESEQVWHMVMDAHQTQNNVVATKVMLQNKGDLDRAIRRACDDATEALRRNLARTDAQQWTADQAACAHHVGNVLFNNMRGGVYDDTRYAPKHDLMSFVSMRNKAAAHKFTKILLDSETRVDLHELKRRAFESGDVDVIRLTFEYLPITFGRRHGDPSRPWNHFEINLKDDEQNDVLDYQGNWRDIFQNWEALSVSYPGFITHIVAKFLNASTTDGNNPYRISREGIDWEVPEEGTAWANYGYWGDHQIIYLLKLLELSESYHAGELRLLLNERLFSFANVPYRLRGFEAIADNPRITIDFDRELNDSIAKKVEALGSDARLVMDETDQVVHVTMMEKLLIAMLAKVSNLVPGGGIWMNTQRPEWNDANNALAGYGVSIVTLCYLRRYCAFIKQLLEGDERESYDVTSSVVVWARGIGDALRAHCEIGKGADDPAARWEYMSRAGRMYETYRKSAYTENSEGFEEISNKEILSVLDNTLECLDQTLETSMRSDYLFDSYNVVKIEANSAEIEKLTLMLEGQVAVLSSGYLDAPNALRLLKRLRQSDLYRSDQHSYILYPFRDIAGYLLRNRLDKTVIENNELLKQCLSDGDTGLVARDEEGNLRYSAELRDTTSLKMAMDKLREVAEYDELVDACYEQTIKQFETEFNHHSFTGRSGTMYAYEGLGSIYWHMVSKLLLAVQEVYVEAYEMDVDSEIVDALREAYYDIREGLGFNKTAESYGAFPSDPYSHTPWERGAQQPGMTGQVKEEILTRYKELGLFVEDGCVVFRPHLLREQEYFGADQRITYLDVNGEEKRMTLPPYSLGYTFCQVPILYKQSTTGEPHVLVNRKDGAIESIESLKLDKKTSRAIFDRTGEVEMLEVCLVPRYV
ncbi:hypothetical protein KS4_15210 [Poriferisphaera corsica]|uniref:Cellobiose phosphorylase n=1 Tax=Poriferisphaera corsica TaxID=2528020 RepID=A0A517YTB0_9BACT|nr:hypothetical protein [Poriferisphaera corsica]QDU33473.1 hypothetical protein KS4_15210 [Poriferisphaera corsica]